MMRGLAGSGKTILPDLSCKDYKYNEILNLERIAIIH